MAEKAKKLSFLTVISTVICVVFVCEAAAPAAAIGNQQFFWWIFLILTFLLPYGMIVAELGTTYDGEGGIYDWVREGLGDKWGARISFYYWVNYPLWIASLATMFPDILGMVFGITFDLPAAIAIELAFVWIVYLIGRSKVADSEWVLNGGAILNGIFWMLFGTSVVFLLLTYIPMFPAFLNLRKNDPDRERVFRFPFEGALMKVALAVPCIELVLTIVATVVPLSEAEIADKVPMLIGFIVLLLIGEVVRIVSARGRKEEYRGLTPKLAAARLAAEAEEADGE